MDISKETFQRRCLELARLFGTDVDCYEKLPAQLTEFFETIGYCRVRNLLVIKELSREKNGRTRSQTAIARQYEMTRRQVGRIKANCRKGPLIV